MVMSTNVVLCGANSYEKKYFFNNDFEKLPQNIKDELQIMCVTFTEEEGGILLLEFDADGMLIFKTEFADADIYCDEISCGLLLKKYREEKQELFSALEMFYRVFIVGDSLA